jgi:hypothetical protein
VNHSKEYILSLIDTLRLHTENNPRCSNELREAISNLPSKWNLVNLTTISMAPLLKTIEGIWKQITDGPLPEEHYAAPQEAKDVDGNFWLLPGGVMIHGTNHFSAAKANKGLICSLLSINPLIAERAFAGPPEEIIGLMLKNGAIRTHIDRNTSSVLMQCTQHSWTETLKKIVRMYHKNRTVKVIDTSKPYHGWESGVPLSISKTHLEKEAPRREKQI